MTEPVVLHHGRETRGSRSRRRAADCCNGLLDRCAHGAGCAGGAEAEGASLELAVFRLAESSTYPLEVATYTKR